MTEIKEHNKRMAEESIRNNALFGVVLFLSPPSRDFAKLGSVPQLRKFLWGLALVIWY